MVLTSTILFAENDSREKTESEATVYIMRPSFVSWVLRSSIDIDDVYLGSTYGFTYIKTRLSPGTYTITGELQNRSHLSLDVEAGETYYIKQRIIQGFVTIDTELVLVDEEKAVDMLKKCKPSQEQSLNTNYVQY
jgi:hypothetical protein